MVILSSVKYTFLLRLFPISKMTCENSTMVSCEIVSSTYFLRIMEIDCDNIIIVECEIEDLIEFFCLLWK